MKTTIKTLLGVTTNLPVLLVCGLVGASFAGCGNTQNGTASIAPGETQVQSPVQRRASEAASASVTSAGGQTSAAPPVPARITFQSPDGVEIVGTFYPPAQPNSPAVLLLHQWGGERGDYDDFAKQLQTHGIGALAIDGRGFGESTTQNKKKVGARHTEDAVTGMKSDIERAFDFLAHQTNVDAGRIGLVGASYGSSLAIIHGAENPRVKAVVLLSPGLNYFNTLPTEPAVKAYGERPLLIIAAEDDKDSASASRRLAGLATGGRHELKIYQSGGHGTNLFAARADVEQHLEEFLLKNLS